MNKIKTTTQNADDISFFDDFPADEPITLAVVLRGYTGDINQFKEFLRQSDLTLIYKRLSYGHLYITDKQEGTND